MRKLFMMFYIFIVSTIYASNYPVIDRAMEKMDYDKKLFSYSVLLVSEGAVENSKKIYKFNPELEDGYELLEIDGEKPTKKDIKKFIEVRNKDREDNDYSGDYYENISENNGIALFKYTTRSNMIPEKESKMAAKVWVDLENEVVLKLEIKSTKEIIMDSGVPMSEFKLELDFKQYNNITVIESMNMEVTVHSSFAQFKQKSSFHMYDYQMVN